MATIRRYQDLVVWQKAREFKNFVFQLTLLDAWPAGKLKGQALESAAACAPNIAEGFGRGGNAEFVSFLGIAKASALESSSHLYDALDRGFITEEELDRGVALADEVCNLAGGLISYLERSGMRGPKFRHRPAPPKPKTPHPKPTPKPKLNAKPKPNSKLNPKPKTNPELQTELRTLNSEPRTQLPEPRTGNPARSPR